MYLSDVIRLLSLVTYQSMKILSLRKKRKRIKKKHADLSVMSNDHKSGEEELCIWPPKLKTTTTTCTLS